MTREKQFTLIAIIFILFSIIGVLDIITAQFIEETDIGYVYIALTFLAGTVGAFIATLSRIWIVWFLIGLFFASRARKESKVEKIAP